MSIWRCEDRQHAWESRQHVTDLSVIGTQRVTVPPHRQVDVTVAGQALRS